MVHNTFVEVVEVGPRDGLQNEKANLTIQHKARLIEQLIESGVQRLEVGSFVNPKKVPQMKDTGELIQNLELKSSNYLALIPNMKGLELAISNNCKAITLVLAVSDTFNIKNIGRSTQRSLEELVPIVEKAKLNDIYVRVDIATAFWCPFENKISVNTLLEIVTYIDQFNVDEIVLCDTIGKANPKQVKQTFEKVLGLNLKSKIGAHFHDTYKRGYANIYAALEAGVRIFDASVAGLGGCPFAPGATGNVATEDVVNLLHSMGYSTNVNEEKISTTANWIKYQINNENLQSIDCY